MFVSGATTRAPAGAIDERRRSARALAWSSPSRSRWCVERVQRRGGEDARSGACRRRAASAPCARARIVAASPTRIAPTGQPSPLEKLSITVCAQCGRSRRAACPWRRARSTAARRPCAPGSRFASATARIASQLGERRTPCPPRRCACSRRRPALASGRVRRRGRSVRCDVARRSRRVDRRRRGTGRDLHARERGGARHLPVDDVRVGVEQHLRARRRVHPDRRLVRHRPAREEEPRLLAEQLRDARLEAPHRRIAIEDVVAHLGVGHRAAHGGGGTGDGVGAEVDRRDSDRQDGR